MVCDMVEQPKRVAELALRWWTDQSARRMIFNLKLPMKKRWNEIEDIRELMSAELKKSGRPYRLLMKHLYHDREEITVYLGPNG
jgi:23S rRNA (cytidine2498-2'-O)-methyltransferase